MQRLRLFKSNNSIEFPSISIEPLLILYSLNNSFTSVLLPEPVAPTIPIFFPELISKLLNEDITKKANIVVIGAGFTGLAAARRLAELGFFDESKKKDDKGNRGFLGWRSSVDWMTGGLTDLDKKGNEFNLINPDNKKEKIEKLQTARKPKTIMIIKTVNKSSNSGSTTLQIPKSVKSMGVSQSSVNSTIKTIQELESAFT